MGKYDFYYPKLKKKKFEFEKKILKFKKEKDENKKICFAQNALSYAAFNGCGYFYCAELEKFYTDLAKKYDLKNYNINFIPNSVLHVMTTCYNSGGHTRVVEGWIKRADSNQKHSVVLLKQVSREIPELLKENIKNKNGELFIFNLDDNQIEKALKLRKLALEYEFIVLHTHMDDPVATIAFGSEKFTRPVILFNHADHMFWIGKSIADITADIQGGSSITPSKRLIKNPFFLGIPYDDKKIEYSKEEAREKLDIPLDKKIVLTIGSDFKYFPFGKISYKKSLEKLFEKDKNLLFFAIGVKKSNPFLQGLNKEHLKRIVFLGNLDYEKEVLESVEINIQYEGYIKKANKEAEKMLLLENKLLPENISYQKIPNLASEARQKLEEIKPITLGQASRISGVNPADIAILSVYLKKEVKLN